MHNFDSMGGADREDIGTDTNYIAIGIVEGGEVDGVAITGQEGAVDAMPDREFGERGPREVVKWMEEETVGGYGEEGGEEVGEFEDEEEARCVKSG